MSKGAPVPQFQSLEEERDYWEARGPLAAGRRPRLHTPEPGHKVESYLSVRLPGRDIDRLREVAARHGVGPSTFARRLIEEAIKQGGPSAPCITWEEIGRGLQERLSPADLVEIEKVLGPFAIGKPPYLLDLSMLNTPEGERLARAFLKLLLAVLGVRLVESVNRSPERASAKP